MHSFRMTPPQNAERSRAMPNDYWYISLPTSNRRLKGESIDDHANRELAELVGRGWEPISVTRTSDIGRIGFLLRKELGA
jgi:hypothetical protein